MTSNEINFQMDHTYNKHILCVLINIVQHVKASATSRTKENDQFSLAKTKQIVSTNVILDQIWVIVLGRRNATIRSPELRFYFDFKVT